MEVVHTHCAGLDIHKKSIAACSIVSGTKGQSRKEVRTYGTMTEDIVKLAQWLSANGVTHVAMEVTGEYWKPIYNILEVLFESFQVYHAPWGTTKDENY